MTGSRILMVLAAVSLIACDNPVGEEVHTTRAGVVLRAGSTDLAGAGSASVAGVVALAPGGQTPEITVHFLDQQGAVVANRSGYYLEVSSSTPTVATWVHTSPGSFTGRIVATGVGATQLEFRLMHGRVGSGHPDARFAIAVAVTAPVSTTQTGDNQ